MSTAANHLSARDTLVTHRTAHIQSDGTSVPWYVWLGALAITSSSIGEIWDVSWHRTIGRDTFWTPAHLTIYFCGVLAGIIGVWLTVQSTF
jgi:hypothetical protein